MTPVQPFQCVSGATYPCKTPPTARKISSVSAVPQFARLGGGWCSLELSGLRWKTLKQEIAAYFVNFISQPLCGVLREADPRASPMSAWLKKPRGRSVRRASAGASGEHTVSGVGLLTTRPPSS